MNKPNLIKILCLSALIFSIASWANESDQGDMYFSGYTPSMWLENQKFNTDQEYTVLDAAQYNQTVKNTRLRIQNLLYALKPYRSKNINTQVKFIAQQLTDIPYIFTGGMGEGDWQPQSKIYQAGAIHIKQDPVYRLDGLDCQTFVQVVMGLLYSKNLNQFDETSLKISYGAAGNFNNEIVHYYNRNNFVDGDWNPINEKNGWLTDVTTAGVLAPFSKTTSAMITRQNWFLFQQQNLSANIRVLADANGPSMVQRFMTTYSALNYPHFDSEYVAMTYLPKELLAIQQSDGSYQPNQNVLDKIPTPAVAEIIRDVKKWTIGGKNIKDIIGTELNVSHLGLLYRQSFHKNELIYRKITCNYNNQHQKICDVTPIICQENKCNKLMFVHATDAYPNGYYWYAQKDGKYVCSAALPASGVSYTTCNRVTQMPLFDYLTTYQYGAYSYMNSASIVGLHIESLV